MQQRQCPYLNAIVSRGLQPVRNVEARGATDEVEIATSNGAAAINSQASYMLDFEELSDIVRSVRSNSAGLTAA